MGTAASDKKGLPPSSSIVDTDEEGRRSNRGGDNNGGRGVLSALMMGVNVPSFNVPSFIDMPDTFVTEANKRGMTKGRVVARYLSRYRWYDPYASPETEDSSKGDDDDNGEDGEGTMLLPPRKTATTDDETTGAPYDSTATTDHDDAEAAAAPPPAPTHHNQSNHPNLDAAWTYFEHITLPRRFVDSSGKFIERAVDSIKAEPGESFTTPTKLYDPLNTKCDELADFGLGIGMYFYTLRALSLLMLIAGLIHLPSFVWFSSKHYSSHGQKDLPLILRGSAICTDTQWVPCPSCAPPDRKEDNLVLDELWSTNRITYTIAADGTEVYYALKNDCSDDLFRVGIVSWIATVFLAVSLIGLGFVQRKIAIEFDERNATCTDFSVCIANPPGDAKDCDEWKDYFESVVATHLEKHPPPGGATISSSDRHVTCVTVALNNHDLIDALVQRRKLKERIAGYLVEDSAAARSNKSLDECYDEWRRRQATTCTDAAVEDGTLLGKRFGKLSKLDEHIAALQQKRYETVRVFATFETEVGQRAALTALDVGNVDVWRNNVNALKDRRYAFKGKYVLDCFEPTEPLTVRWNDLGRPWRTKRLATTISSFLLIVAAYEVLRYIFYEYGGETTALCIAITNVTVPKLCRFITSYEVHVSEGRRQVSLNFKVALFRFINSAIIIHLITPFPWSITSPATDGKKDHLIAAVCAIFIAEMWTAPLLQMADIPNNIKRHIVAPRQTSQEAMNLCFGGARWELSERYTNMMKIIFMCFFFSTVFPNSFFLASFSLLIHYEVDKFCLLRVWGAVPSLGSHVAELNRTVVVPILIVALSCLNAYFWSGFPFDNICEGSDKIPDEYTGVHEFTPPNGGMSVSISQGDKVYHACSQDFLARVPLVFPPLPQFQGTDENVWMSAEQDFIVTLHAWTGVGVIILTLLYLLFKSELSEKLVELFRANYQPSGKIYGVDFSDVVSVADVFPAYVPQVKAKGFSLPLITCELSMVDPRLVGWKDHRIEGFSHQSLLFDVPGRKNEGAFSVIKQWKPPGG